MVSKTDQVGRAPISGTSQSDFVVWDPEAELNASPELRAQLSSSAGRSFRNEFVLSHQIFRLRLFRKSLGITQVELAKKMGVSQIRVSQIENGKLEKFELGTLMRYVEALGGKLKLSVELDGKQLVLSDLTHDTLEVWGD